MQKKPTKRNRRKGAPKKKKVVRNRSKKSTARNHGSRKKPKTNYSLPNIAPWKVIVGIIVIGALGILYLRHVFATQKLLAEVQQVEEQYKQAKRSHDNYRLKYDRMIGPAEIYSKAKAQGFINGGPADKVIEVENE